MDLHFFLQGISGMVYYSGTDEKAVSEKARAFQENGGHLYKIYIDGRAISLSHRHLLKERNEQGQAYLVRGHPVDGWRSHDPEIPLTPEIIQYLSRLSQQHPRSADQQGNIAKVSELESEFDFYEETGFGN